MKKLFLLFCVCICLLFMQNSFSLSNISKKFSGTHTFFSTENFCGEQTTTTKNGNGFLICCDNKISNQIFEKLDKSKLDGECFCFEGDAFQTQNILNELWATIIKTETTNQTYIIYAYSPKIFDYVFVEGKKINVQIATKNKKIVVGTPLILGGF